ncbi:hypothetical protein CYMTET_12719 [Cymbomonas tetramitiformis]|uniref:Uncharacterized protein n=1 Tax=Cymbomonas tetramitiformis TaxID=36881 RepID=A0AAE0LC57_9CHLO|nr:hypothetical protein CYMTET_12719 [Cymbomonas tetramitiformis]
MGIYDVYDERRATVVLQLTRDIDVVKRVAKDTLGNKASSFSGSVEPHRRVLWDSLISSRQQSFAAKDSNSDDMFDLVDLGKERLLLEITKRPLPLGHRPLRHHEELLNISFGADDDPEPLVTQFYECLNAIDGAGAFDEKAAKRQLLAALDPDFYREVITRPLRLDTELVKVPLEEIFTHVLHIGFMPPPPFRGANHNKGD